MLLSFDGHDRSMTCSKLTFYLLDKVIRSLIKWGLYNKQNIQWEMALTFKGTMATVVILEVHIKKQNLLIYFSLQKQTIWK